MIGWAMMAISLVVEPGGLSVEDALAKIRAARRNGDGSVAKVEVRGVQELSRTLTFTPEDHDIEFEGTQGAEITGARKLGKWKVEADGTWSAPLPRGADGKPIWFESLFVNGRRADRARIPNSIPRDDPRPRTAGYFVPASSREAVIADEKTKAIVRTDEFTAITNAEIAAILAATPQEELAYAQLGVRHRWSYARRPVDGYDAASNVIRTCSLPTAMGKARRFHSWGRWDDGSLLFLENVRGGFDAPGEWFYDMRDSVVRYRPIEGERPERTVATAPLAKLSRLVDFCGKPESEKMIRNIVFRNIAFTGTATTPEHGDDANGPTRSYQFQAAIGSDGAITATGIDGIAFDRCRVMHTANYAMRFDDGCRHVKITRCTLEDLGAGGVMMGASGGFRAKGKTVVRGENPADSPKSTAFNEISDCVIRQGGLINPEGTAVALTHCSDTKVIHNEICDFFYTGVSVGWIWGYRGSVAQRNTIAFNRIHDFGKGEMSDMGGVYTLGCSYGTCVSNNVIYNVRCVRYGGWGLYCDEGSENVVMENNLVYNTDDGGMHQHYGSGNVIRNNIFAKNRRKGVMVTSRKSADGVLSTIDLIGNVFYTEEGPLVGERTFGVFGVYADNLWFKPGAEKEKFGWYADFAAYIASGRSRSDVFADPMFVDAAHDDYRLRPESPALKLGFRPFDVSAAGVRQ